MKFTKIVTCNKCGEPIRSNPVWVNGLVYHKGCAKKFNMRNLITVLLVFFLFSCSGQVNHWELPMDSIEMVPAGEHLTIEEADGVDIFSLEDSIVIIVDTLYWFDLFKKQFVSIDGQEIDYLTDKGLRSGYRIVIKDSYPFVNYGLDSIVVDEYFTDMAGNRIEKDIMIWSKKRK